MALVSGTTYDALRNGQTAFKWVVAIDGYPRLLTDAKPQKAIDAWAGTDWTQAVDGLVVDMVNEQMADPHDPFQGGGRCILHVSGKYDDTFGTELNRRAAGAWTTLAATIDRDDTALSIRSNSGFDAGPAEAHIGIECVEYSGTTSSTMTVTTRGKYTAIGTAGGSGGSRFSDHHRVTVDERQVQMNPVVSQQPRRWIGRRVHVYLHKVDYQGNLNAKADARLVFSGRIAGLGDDPNNFNTVITCRHVKDELANAIIGRNQWGGTAMQGIYIPAGAVFSFVERKGGATTSATNLTVLASGASGSNQINAGYYSLEEICSFLNAWLGGNLAAATISGHYTWTSPREGPTGLRTECAWSIADASSATLVNWEMSLPSGVAGFLGLTDALPIATTATTKIVGHKGFPNANAGHFHNGDHVPYRTVVFSKGGPGGNLPSFRITCENEHGEFVDQYDYMPSIIKPGLDPSKPWGLFLVDEKVLIQASYAAGVLSDCYITPLGQTSAGDSGSPEPFYMLGRRADDDRGPVTIRQVFDLEGSFLQLMFLLHYNTGTPGYNHPTYDTDARGFGVGLPGGLLGDAFERSLEALPDAEQVMRLRFDEPIRLAELIGGELLARGAFPVWKNGGIVYQRWHTPVVALASFSITEDDKAAPAGNQVNHRTPALETAEHARPITKVDFDPDFAFGREIRYRASLQLEDHVGVDDAGGEVPEPLTIKLRNWPGGEVPTILSSILARMPMTSRPSRFLERSIGPHLAEGIAPGDICLLYDNFARDPLTGQRGISGRPAVVMRHEWNFGGPVPGAPQEDPRPMEGKIELNFFDVNRGSTYGSAADIDESENSGGFSAGYNSGTLTLRCKEHAYSEASEGVDAAGFGDGYRVIIVEKDPTDPANPLKWERTLATPARSGSDLTLTSALSSPAWDPAKQYRIIFDRYSVATTLQRDHAFQADDADEKIEDLEVPFEWAITPEESAWTYNTTEPTELIPELSHGDGRSWDLGHEKAHIVTLNNLIDHKTAHHVLQLLTELEVPATADVWTVRHFYRAYLGLDQLSNAVFRYLTIAPWMQLDNTFGRTQGDVRVTISRDLPTNPHATASVGFFDPTWTGPHAQATFTTTSTTWAIPTEQTLEVRIKDLFWGLAYITIEVRNAQCRGLAKAREGARVLVL